jgi:hypothetical protein
MATTGTPVAAADKAETSKARPEPIVLDLGKKKRKAIRRLRKGKGRLMEQILDTHAQLSSSGVCEPSAQPVVVVVRQKPKRRGLW